MRLAVIDLGTNSARLSIHDYKNGDLSLIHKEKIRVALGTSVFNKGIVDFKLLSRTVAAFREFSERVEDFKVDYISAMATSALREAQNGQEVCHIIQKKTGITVEIISGEKEALLIAKGVLNNENLNPEHVGLIDIGGGSTEVSVWTNGTLENCESLALGGLRFQELVLKSHPPSVQTIRKTRGQVRRVLGHRIRNWNMGEQIYGTGGTIKVLGIVLRGLTGKNQIERDDLACLVQDFSEMNLKDIQDLPGMTEGKAPIILAGGIILETMMDLLDLNSIIPTQYSLKDGILATLVDQVEKIDGDGIFSFLT